MVGNHGCEFQLRFLTLVLGLVGFGILSSLWLKGRTNFLHTLFPSNFGLALMGLNFASIQVVWALILAAMVWAVW